MLLAEVIGTVVASRKEETLEGLRFLVLRRWTLHSNPQVMSWLPLMPSVQVWERLLCSRREVPRVRLN